MGIVKNIYTYIYVYIYHSLFVKIKLDNENKTLSTKLAFVEYWICAKQLLSASLRGQNEGNNSGRDAVMAAAAEGREGQGLAEE